MSNAEEMGATVIGATPNEAQGVVLDLSGVDYLDSAGIYVIYGMRASLQARGQSLILVIPPSRPVHDALRLSGAERPGEIADTVEERPARDRAALGRRSLTARSRALERDLLPVAAPPVADLGIDLVRGRVGQVGEQHAAGRAAGQRASADRRHRAPRVAPAPERGRRVDRTDRGRRRPPRD